MIHPNNDELEQQWRQSLSRLSSAELLQFFPEAKHVLPAIMKEWQRKQQALESRIRTELLAIKQSGENEMTRWFWREMIKHHCGDKLLNIDQQISRVKGLTMVSKGKTPKGWLSQEQINLALQVPITTQINQRFRKSGKTLIGLCPLHKEKHGSFTIYLETNTCWCFGCSQGGNVIKLIRLLYGCSFTEAVKQLIGK